MVEIAGYKETRPHPADERRERILDGAFRVFLAYGYTRTTMDDIARAAEISRPALYLLFRNKQDIYTALAARFLDQLLERTRAVLAEAGPLSVRLERMCEDVFYRAIREIEDSPHGAELLDARNELAARAVAEWRVGLDAALADAIGIEAEANGVDLEAKGFSSEILASMLNDAMEGMKVRLKDPRLHLDRARRYLKVVGAVLER